MSLERLVHELEGLRSRAIEPVPHVYLKRIMARGEQDLLSEGSLLGDEYRIAVEGYSRYVVDGALDFRELLGEQGAVLGLGYGELRALDEGSRLVVRVASYHEDCQDHERQL